jgi:membrane protein
MKTPRLLEDTRASFARLHTLSRHAPLGWLGMLLIYGRLTVARFFRNNGFTRSSALSYSLLFALIPGIASLALFANQARQESFFSQNEISSFVLRLLPYSTDEINAHIMSFVQNSMTIGWIGVSAFFLTLLMLVAALENIFNTTWNVAKDRPVHMQVGMMIVIILLFIAAFAVSFKLRHSRIVDAHLLIRIPFVFFSFVFLSLAFTVLYRLIPRVKVRLDAALIGGVLAAGLYEVGRFGFRLYVGHFSTYSAIYGPFGLLAVFIVSLYMLSMFVVLGAEMSCVAQNYEEYCRQHLMRKGMSRIPLMPEDDEFLI